jgi:hypothetical protein
MSKRSIGVDVGDRPTALHVSIHTHVVKERVVRRRQVDVYNHDLRAGTRLKKAPPFKKGTTNTYYLRHTAQRPGIHEPAHEPVLPRLADDKCSRKTNKKKSKALAHKRYNYVVTTGTIAFRPSRVVIFAVGVFSFDGCPSCRFPWPSALSQG